MNPFSQDELAERLKTKTLGRNAVFLDTVDSTNSEARRMLETSCPDGTVIIAAQQTAGRGRRGRRWVSAPGCGLWLTAVIRPFMPLEEMQKLTLLIGLAVCKAVEQNTGGAARPMIKWPNDVLIGGRKLSGILCESAMDGAGERRIIAGIGVNTGTPEMGYGDADGVAISLAEAVGEPIGRLPLAAEILNETELLLESWHAESFAVIARDYRQYMMPAGTVVEISDGISKMRGSIEALDDGGVLIVRMDTGNVERIISGEISVRGVAGNV